MRVMEGHKFKHRIKIVVVGDAHAGKTGFVEAYLKGKEYEKRKGTGQNDLYECSAILEDKQEAKIDLCSIARNENNAINRRFAYPDTSVFLLCFSLISESSLDNIEARWVPELVTREGFKILVGCKKDKRDDRDRLSNGVKRGMMVRFFKFQIVF